MAVSHPILSKTPWSLIAALASGFLLALCFPRFNVEHSVWLWAAPLMIALWWLPVGNERRRGRRGFLLGYVSGITFFAINLTWIQEVTIVGWLIFPFYLGLYFGVWGWIAATAGRPRDERLAAPYQEDKKPSLLAGSLHALNIAFINASAWVGLEWLRGWVMTGFGWNGLGIALHENLNLIQIADMVGVSGLSFLPMFVGCVLVTTVRRFSLEIRHQILRPHLDFGIALLLVAGCFLYGLRHTLAPAAEGTQLRCLLIQMAVPQMEKWDESKAMKILEDYEELTSTFIEATSPEFVIWPESSLPTPIFYDPANERYLDNLLAKGDFTFMLGVNDFDATADRYYNSAAIMRGRLHTPDLDLYHKIHLVPFGEFIPFREQLPFLANWLERVIPGDFSRGESTDPLPYPDKEFTIIPLICFEDTVGRLARQFVRKEPQLMVNLTNDGWFGTSPAAEQHVANARIRCIELRRPMARATNTGVTCLIDPTGRFTTKLDDLFNPGGFVNTITIPHDAKLTFYAKFGDLFTGVVSLLGVMAILRHVRRHRAVV